MPDYVKRALERLNHKPPKKAKHTPHKWIPKSYGKQVHLAHPDDDSPLLPDLEKNYIQKVVGTFLYYARAVDSTIHTAINEISMSQAKPTEKTKDAVIM